MALAPFREFLSLIVLDGNFDLPQHLFAGFTDRCTEGGNGGRRVEVEHGEEILVEKVFLRLQSAAGQQGVGGADDSGISERCPDVEVIIFFQKRTVNDANDVILIVVPVFIHKLGGDGF